MRSFLLPVLLTALSVSGAESQEPRKQHPFIPSLLALTEEEEKKVDAIVDRFIQYDIGKLRGAEGQQAVRDFQKLGSEAIPGLIRGLNRAAAINHSCPVTVISAKLQRFFASTSDLKLLDFARDEIGGGVGRSIHAAVLQDLRFYASSRRNVLVRAGVKPLGPMPPTPRTLSTSALIDLIQKERGETLRSLLTEMGQRNGNEVVNTLGISAASYERENQQAARASLVSILGRLKPEDLKVRMRDEKPEVRLAAVKVVSNKQLRFGSELIERLADDDATVRVWARETLVRMAKHIHDFGPAANATKEQREQAVQKWREWWQKQASR